MARREPTLGQHAHPRRAPTPRLRAEQLDRPALPGVSRRSRPTALADAALPEPRAVSRRGVAGARGDDRQLAPHGYLDRFTAATEGLGAQASDEDQRCPLCERTWSCQPDPRCAWFDRGGRWRPRWSVHATAQRAGGSWPPDPRMEYWRPTGTGHMTARRTTSVGKWEIVERGAGPLVEPDVLRRLGERVR